MMKVESNAVKKKYCIGTWNVRSMNQDKLEVVKQEMIRVNNDILGISESNSLPARDTQLKQNLVHNRRPHRD